MTKLTRGELNLLSLRLTYLNRKLILEETWMLTELKQIYLQIENWYNIELSNVKHQAQADEHQSDETVRVDHYELHRKILKNHPFLN